MRKAVLVFICAALCLSVLCSCYGKGNEFKGTEITSIEIYFDFDEADVTKNQAVYTLSVVKAASQGLNDHCVFHYVVEAPGENSYEWTEDEDGTKHMHDTTPYSGPVNIEYDINTFESILSTIKKGKPSIYTGPGSDSSGRIERKTLPFMIVLRGVDNTYYIDSINNKDKLFDTLEKLENTTS